MHKLQTEGKFWQFGPIGTSMEDVYTVMSIIKMFSRVEGCRLGF